METHNKIMPKMAIIPTCMPDKEINHFAKCWAEISEEKQSSIRSVWDEMRELQLKAVEEYCRKKEEALTQAILSCGYQYDEVIQYVKQGARFYTRQLQFGTSFNGHTEYVLYDSYTQRAFILITESSTMNIEDCESKAFSQMQIIAHNNRQVPYNYHR